MSFISPKEYPSTVLAKDSQDNAEATATASASAGNSYHITGVDASFTTKDTVKLLQLKDGSTVVWENYVHTSANITFASPIKGTVGNSFSAVLSASGTSSNLGKINLRGYLV